MATCRECRSFDALTRWCCSFEATIRQPGHEQKTTCTGYEGPDEDDARDRADDAAVCWDRDHEAQP